MKTRVILSLLFLLSFGSVRAADLFIEAESFSNKGGWKVDQQFMDLMGSPYLLAHGMGVPVDDASTEVTFPEKGEWQFANLHECLPDYVCASLEEGMRAFGHKIKGYDAEDTVFSGVETRTSSPLRMERNKQFESNIQGLFPCGEGAGYAGGITSAAMDGIKTAEAIAEKILTQN